MFNVKKPREEECTSLIHMLTRKAAEIRWTCFCFLGLMVNSSCMLTTGLGGERLGWVGLGGRWWCGEGGGEVSAFLWKGWQGLLTLWERTSYKTEEAHFHFKGSSETWHQQASLLSSRTLARCTLAHMRVHINVCVCTYIHTSSDRLTFTDTLNVSPSPPHPQSNVYSYLRKMRWYSFSSRLKNSQKLKKKKKRNFKAPYGAGYTLMNTSHISHTQTHSERPANNSLSLTSLITKWILDWHVRA